jgi:hypothetical protein
MGACRRRGAACKAADQVVLCDAGTAEKERRKHLSLGLRLGLGLN